VSTESIGAPASAGDGLPDRTELTARAVSLRPLLREHQTAAEHERRVADPVIEGLTEAGLFRLLTPRRFGGYEAGVRTLLEVTEALGEADASAAWLVSVGSVASWIACRVSEQAQRDIFGADPDARIAGGSDPLPARRVDGGIRVSGRCSWASGSHHATWASLGAAITDGDGQIIDVRLCLVPVSEVQLEGTWRTVGMRGTGSNTWLVEDVFVPEHRMISAGALAQGTWPAASDEPLYRAPFGPLATVPLLGPLLGAGQAALGLVIDKAGSKPIQHSGYPRQSDSVGVQTALAEAALTLETARMHAYQVADAVDEVAAGRALSQQEHAGMRARCAYAAQQVLDAFGALLNVHGAGSFAEPSRMQQYWRDVNTAARHAALNEFVGYELYGKALLGLDNEIDPFL
jgi:3-hydroxy-9,10-secoandrosta-1,3,5(10)-triene-9,17-dione monooxygenase